MIALQEVKGSKVGMSSEEEINGKKEADPSLAHMNRGKAQPSAQASRVHAGSGKGRTPKDEL